MGDSLVAKDSGWGRTVAVAVAVGVFAVCSIAAAVKSKGFLEADGGTHYLYARHAFAEPYYFVDVWGRPLFTALMAVPATVGGLLGVRLTSLAVAIGCALVAYRIAVGQGYRWPALAAIFTLGQPLFFLHSFSELTELPFALVIGGALLAYQKRWWGVMAGLVALAPLGRPEGFGFVLLAGIALVAHRRMRWLIVLPVGLAGWSIAGHIVVGPREMPWWRWLIDHWPYDAKSQYRSGNLLQFVGMLPMLVGPFAFPAMWIGMWRGVRIPVRELLVEHRRRVQWLIAALPLGVLVAHSLFYWLGKFSSDGELRYLLVTAPMWGLLSAAGWEWIFTRMRWRQITQWAALAVVAPGCVNYAWRVLPLEPSTSWLEAQRVAQWYQSDRNKDLRAKYPRILCNHPGIYFYLDISPTDKTRVVAWSKEDAANPGPGVLMLWDPEYCVRNASGKFIVTLPEAMADGWVNDWRAEIASNVNNPSPWDNYKILTKPPKPVDMSLPNTWMLWHLFRSPVDAQGHSTAAVAREEGPVQWRETPGSPFRSR